ncbi:PfkB family carbohydrate kinase, partial [Nocardia abscessus]|uniref:PfkB family carbohydrate kinase n=1 Tax=Nocardia abscessus TaxID=120957 RepID=UPI0024555AEB
ASDKNPGRAPPTYHHHGWPGALPALLRFGGGPVSRPRADDAGMVDLLADLLGAGDGFGGALIHGLLSDWDPRRIATYANAAGALVATRVACAAAMATAGVIEELLCGCAGAGAEEPPCG